MPENGEAWLHLAGLALGGDPAAAACGLPWRKGHGLEVSASAALAVPAVVAGTVAVDGFRPMAAGMVAVSASQPAWLLYAVGGPRRGPLG
ncbi:MAG: hypothetical protein OXO52_11465 [Rhodospirillales bacterium]|nr:hypothetical protein [Rhodospirillales bacterium]MDE0382164.1 hypothetical protein [Rhodospirillales bacterium]